MVKLRKEIKGNVYGHLVALGEFKRKNGEHGRIFELCRCTKCGYEHYVDRQSLIRLTAGCRKCSHLSHGLSDTRFYQVWRNINQRCKTPRFKCYRRKGIKVEWKTFEEFKADMHESYEAHVKEYGEMDTSIDRIDSNGNYCKENCRWATCEEQANNTSRNTGLTKMCREKGVSYETARYYYRKGLSVEEAVKKAEEKFYFTY